MRQSKPIISGLLAILVSVCLIAALAGCTGKTKGDNKDQPVDPKAQAEEEFNAAKELIGSDSAKDVREGMKRAMKSLELVPDQPKPACAIGTAHRKLKDYDKAIEWYNKAIKLDPKYTVCHDNLGLAYHAKMMTAKSDADRENAFDKARDEFLKAAELDKAYADAHYNLGELYSWLDDEKARNEAIKEYEKFIQMTDKPDMKESAQKSVVKLKKQQ